MYRDDTPSKETSIRYAWDASTIYEYITMGVRIHAILTVFQRGDYIHCIRKYIYIYIYLYIFI